MHASNDWHTNGPPQDERGKSRTIRLGCQRSFARQTGRCPGVPMFEYWSFFPKGSPKVAQRFIAGHPGRFPRQVPKGRLKEGARDASSVIRPIGTKGCSRHTMSRIYRWAFLRCPVRTANRSISDTPLGSAGTSLGSAGNGLKNRFLRPKRHPNPWLECSTSATLKSPTPNPPRIQSSPAARNGLPEPRPRRTARRPCPP